ncbi:MAG: GxxExxY protein [Planctomycetaceae bacterium]|nr:GxxExxY protein [Planctomycetaceae bacterium]
MPISTASQVRVCDRETFHEIDREVTGLAFCIQNEFGRYLDESVYQRELFRRCTDSGLEVVREYPMTVSLDDFAKCYFADLMINNAVIVETKAAETLAQPHVAQTLNYLFLCGLHHGTLLNFRSTRVEHQFVSTSITPRDRHTYEIRKAHWRPLSAECNRLYTTVSRLLAEWGAYLDLVLYREGLVHFLGGSERIEREVAIYSRETAIGSQSMTLLTDEIAFSLTSATRDPHLVAEHQQRLLAHTRLRALHWINFNRQVITIQTITP